MLQGLYSPHINFMTGSVGTTTQVMPTIHAEVTMPYQNTPKDVYDYLKQMDFIHTTSKSGDLWQRKGTTEYFTWEQAVVYCLIKPFLNP
jgi:hypothetical protein